ncbi:type 4a pilus biogenesis protein PilO, partial [candidate division KSB1 bacterium]|nr:type 4a pilus biogenesis protein PilO [candidate division KSB1 bacterium]
KLLFLAAALWVLGVGSLYIVLIEPQVATTEKIREELAELNNTRFLIRTTKLDSILLVMQNDINRYTIQTQAFEHYSLQSAQVPLYISKVLKAATDNGLATTNHDLLSGQFEQNEKSDTQQFIVISLEGKFQQMLDFLDEINSWDRKVLMRNFSLNRIEKKADVLKGMFEVVVTIN